MISWLLLGLLGSVAVAALCFIDEIIEWAKEIFEEISSAVKKAWVYVKRVPGAVKQFVRYIQNGTMYERTEEKPVSLETLQQMRDNGDITQEEYETLVSERERKIAELNR